MFIKKRKSNSYNIGFHQVIWWIRQGFKKWFRCVGPQWYF